MGQCVQKGVYTIRRKEKRSKHFERSEKYIWAYIQLDVCTVSLSFWVSRNAEYSIKRSFDEAMVLSCHTGAVIAAGRGGDMGS